MLYPMRCMGRITAIPYYKEYRSVMLGRPVFPSKSLSAATLNKVGCLLLQLRSEL